MTPRQYNEMMRQADMIEENKKNKEIEKEWEEIREEYLKDEYPVFGGPFTNALTPWEWLKTWYNPPTRKDK